MRSISFRFQFLVISISLASTPIAQADDTARIFGGVLGIILNEAIKDDQDNNRPLQEQPREQRNQVYAPAIPSQPSMTTDERMAVQRALAETGLYDGEIDGAIGPQSRASIAAWQNSIGAESSGILSPQQAQILIDSAPQRLEDESQITFVEASANNGQLVLQPDGFAAGSVERSIFQRELMRRAVFVAPQILEDDQVILSFLNNSDDFAEWNNPDLIGLKEVVYDGTEFERREAMDAIRNIVRSQATDEAFSFVKTENTVLGAYDFGTLEFPISVSDELDFNAESYFGARVSGINFKVNLDAWGGITSVSIPTNQAEQIADLVEKQNGRQVYLAANVTLSNFDVDESGLIADAKVERITAHNGSSQLGALGPVLFDIPNPSAAAQSDGIATASAASDALESWARLGVDVENGRVLFGQNDAYVKEKLTRAFDYLGLSLLPESGPSIYNAATLTLRYLEKADQQAAFDARTLDLSFFNDLGADQFRQRDFAQRFETDYEDALRSFAPALPVRVQYQTFLRVLEYDFDKQIYATDIDQRFQSPNSAPDYRMTLQFGDAIITTDIKGFDSNLPMLPDDARALSDVLSEAGSGGTYGGQLYLGIDMELTSGTASEGRDRGITISTYQDNPDIKLSLTASVERAVIYLDAAMTDPLMELGVIRPEEKVPVDTGTRMPSEPSVSELNLAAFALSQGVEQAAIEGLIKRHYPYRRSDEFTRDTVLGEMADRITSSVIPNDALYLPVQLQLGEHDGEAFAVEEFKVGWSGAPGEQTFLLPDDAFQISLDNLAMLEKLPVERVAASAMVATNAGRVFAGLIRVDLLGAQARTGERNNPDFIGIDVHVLELILSEPADVGRQLFRIGLEPAQAGEQAVVLSDPARFTTLSQPESALLTPETVTLLQIVHAGRALDDALLLDLLRERYRIETQQTEHEQKGYAETVRLAESPWGKFFPEGYRVLTDADEQQLLAAFRRWTELRMAAMPDRFFYEEISSQCSGASGQYGEDVKSPGLFSGAEIGGLPISRGFIQNLFDAANTGIPAPAKTISFSGLGRVADDVLVGLPDLPPPNEYACAVSVGFDITSVVVHNTASSLIPSLLVEIAATQVTWLSERSSQTSREVIGSYQVEPTAASTDGVETEQAYDQGSDVIGLTLGMSLPEVEVQIREHMQVSRVVELSSQDSATTVGERARLYISSDGSDFIIVNYGPSADEPQAYGIARNLFVPLNSFADESLIGKLEQKYGPRRVDLAYAQDTWVWNDTAFAVECGYGGVQPTINFNGTVLEGTPFISGRVDPAQLASDPVFALDVLVVARASNLVFDIGISGSALPDCGEVIRADIKRNWPATVPGLDLSGTEADLFSTRLVAPTRLRQALEEEFKSRVVTEPDIKL